MSDAIDPRGTVGAKIDAIKAIRTYTGLGLLESKLIADAITATYLPERATPPDVHHAHNAHAVTLAKHSVCLHCGEGMARALWGAVFCSERCYTSHRTDTRQENRVYLLDQEIVEAERLVADLCRRREALLNGAE